MHLLMASSKKSEGCSSSIELWIENLLMLDGFFLTPAPFFRFDVPGQMPPVDRGDYSLAAVLIQPGTFDCLSEISFAPFSEGGVGLKAGIPMRPILAGSVMMGSPEDEVGHYDNESPQRTVNIATFSMSETEITKRRWEDVMGWEAPERVGCVRLMAAHEPPPRHSPGKRAARSGFAFSQSAGILPLDGVVPTIRQTS